MSVRALQRSTLKSIPFPLPLSSYVIPRPAMLREFEASRVCEIPTAKGCLRGFCWAIGIEGAAAFCGYGIWQLWQFLR
jgi:hypothetical protein